MNGNPGSTELAFLTPWPADFRYVLALQEASVVAMAGPTNGNLIERIGGLISDVEPRRVTCHVQISPGMSDGVRRLVQARSLVDARAKHSLSQSGRSVFSASGRKTVTPEATHHFPAPVSRCSSCFSRAIRGQRGQASVFHWATHSEMVEALPIAR